jgi:hypothetical protein
VQYALLTFLAVWSAGGMLHLIGKRGVLKASMNGRPEDVVDFVRDSRGPNCSVIVTSDPALTLVAVNSGLSRSLVLTAGQNSICPRMDGFTSGECPGIELYVLKSHPVNPDYAQVLAPETSRAEDAIRRPVRVDSFGFDPDARIKRKLSFIQGARDLPDYHYIVYSGAIGPSEMDALQQWLLHFVVADGRTLPVAHEPAPTNR